MKKTVHYALVLDQSGSMESIKQEVVASFNEQVDMIQKLQRENPEAEVKVTLCMFNDTAEYKFIGDPVDRLTKLSMEDYSPNSMTALYDAMGLTMLRLKEMKQPGDGIFLAVFTDGYENSSREYSGADIRSKIKQAEVEGWEVRFFNRAEEHDFYKHELNLSEKMHRSISMDKKGFKLMENEVCYSMDRLMKE